MVFFFSISFFYCVNLGGFLKQKQKIQTAYGECDDIGDLSVAEDLRVEISPQGECVGVCVGVCVCVNIHVTTCFLLHLWTAVVILMFLYRSGIGR